MVKGFEAISVAQKLCLLGAAAHEDRRVQRFDDGFQNGGGQVASQTNAQHPAPDQSTVCARKRLSSRMYEAWS